MDYLDKHGKPLELLEWAELSGDNDYRRIDFTTLPNGEVSTIWIGHNMNLFPGKPLIFETAILKNGKFVEVFERCDTLENAQVMHHRAVLYLQDA